MHPSISLLLKLAAAITSGAAAMLTILRVRQDDNISSFRREIHAVAAPMLSPSPPSILIVGVRGHGKSSFLNTACRTLANEYGPLLLRAESRPPGGEAGETKRVVYASVDAGGEQNSDEEVTLAMVEKGIGLETTKEDMEAAVAGLEGVDCVVVVIRCSGATKERSLVIRKLPEIATPVRERGLHLIVVLTHKKSIRTTRQAEELQREVAFKARTDCVYFIENYTYSKSSNLRYPAPIKNDFDTHFTMLTVIQQCLEFVKLYRSQSGNIHHKHEKDHASIAARPQHKVAGGQ
ncbi:hypothetical protein LUZ62_040646 [Rhynchospora pubera]|uniref:G domain-containing protein n=1 Tax=Rhynchospora pubera TaxID=906938 RepID=A0AAV8FAS0_9POAL|nr:hypothetical protein LUZ62_040646 [Rhynchospora pubera]